MMRRIDGWPLLLVVLAMVLSTGVPAAPGQTARPSTQAKPQTAEQEPEPEYSDEEYDAYEKATQEKDADKQRAALLAFMEKYPKSKLQPYIVTAYQTLLFQYRKSDDFARLGPAAEDWLKYFPNDLQTIDYAAASAAKLGQDAKFVSYGEKIYAAKPVDDYAFFIAQSYKKLGNQAKYEEWIEKTLAYPKYSNNVGLRYEFVDKHVKEKNLAKAADAARLTLKAAETATKPEGVPDATWQSDVTKIRRSCHYVIGASLYEAAKYADAIRELQQVITLDGKFDMAYYYIGLSQWKLGKIENDEAPLAFAKTVILKGEIADQAKDHLEKIYKAIHNNSLVGVQKIYDRAKEELASDRTAK